MECQVEKMCIFDTFFLLLLNLKKSLLKLKKCKLKKRQELSCQLNNVAYIANFTERKICLIFSMHYLTSSVLQFNK